MSREESPSARAKRVAASAQTVVEMATLYRTRLDALVRELDSLERHIRSVEEILALALSSVPELKPDAERLSTETAP